MALRDTLKKLRNKVLDSTQLDEEAIGFFRPKTGTLATAGRSFLTKNRSVPKSVENTVAGINRAGAAARNINTYNPYRAKNFAITEKLGSNLTKSNQPLIRLAGGFQQQAGNYGKRLLGNTYEGASNISKGNFGKGTLQLGSSVGLAAQGASAMAAPGSAAAVGGLTGLLNAGLSKIGGEDPYSNFGRGAFEGAKTYGVTRFTDPIIGKVAGQADGFNNIIGRQIVTRAATGAGNVAEDYILSAIDKLSGKDSEFNKYASFAMGAALGGNDELIKPIRNAFKKYKAGKQRDKAVEKALKGFIEKTRKDGTTYRQTVGKGGFGKAEDLSVPAIGGGVIDLTEPNNFPSKGKTGMKYMRDGSSVNQINAEGFLAGMEPTQDEEGNWKIKFNPQRAAMGALAVGGLKAVKGGNIKPGELFESSPGVYDIFEPGKGIKIDNAKAIADEANIRAETDIKGFNNIFDRWIGARDAANTKATQAVSKIKDIPQGKEWDVIGFIEGTKSDVDQGVKEAASSIKKQFDDLFAGAKQAGMDINYLKNYITHMWDQSPKEAQEIWDAYRSSNPNFKYSKSRTIPTYEAGIEAGLKPKYDNPQQILGEYTRRLEVSKANLEFLNKLKNNNIIVPASIGKDQPGFKPIIAPGFQNSQTRIKDQTIVGSYYAPAKVADTINRVFSAQEDTLFNNFMGIAAGVSKKAQDILLSGGIPYTPVNAFSAAQLTKELTAGRFGALGTAFKSLSPKSSQKFFEDNAGQIAKLQERNVRISPDFSPENYVSGKNIQKIFGKQVGEAWDKAISDPTFKRFLPMLQVNLFNDIESKLLKQGIDAGVAADRAAKAVSNFYGSTSTGEMARRTKLSKDISSTLLFAPTFRESMINFWKQNIGAVSPVNAEFNRSGVKKAIPSNIKLNNPFSPENINNTRFVLGAIATYAAMDQANRAFNGHGMMDNPEGKKDKLLIPVGDTTIGIPFLSSIATVPRAAFNIGEQLLQGDIGGAVETAGSVFGSSTLKPAADIARNQDYFGRPIYDEFDKPLTKYGKSAAYYTGQTMVPSPVREIGRSIIDPEKNPWWQTATTAMELPIRYYNTQSVQNAPFWEEYNRTKPVAQKYEELSYQDPQRALEFLQENREDIEKHKLMKPYVGQYFDQGKDSSVLTRFTKPEDQVQASGNQNIKIKNDKATRDFIRERIKLGDQVSNEELATSYLGDIQELPSSSKYEKNIKTKKLFSKISDIENTEYLSPEQKDYLFTQIAKEAGLKRGDIDYYQIARQDTDVKMGAVYDQIDSYADDKEAILTTLIEGRYEVNGQRIVNNTVVDNLVADGVISKAEGKAIKAYKYDQKTGKVKASGSGSKGKAISIKKVSYSSPSLTKIKAPTSQAQIPTIKLLNQPSGAAPQITPPKFTTRIQSREPNSRVSTKIVQPSKIRRSYGKM